MRKRPSSDQTCLKGRQVWGYVVCLTTLLHGCQIGKVHKVDPSVHLAPLVHQEPKGATSPPKATREVEVVADLGKGTCWLTRICTDYLPRAAKIPSVWTVTSARCSQVLAAGGKTSNGCQLAQNHLHPKFRDTGRYVFHDVAVTAFRCPEEVQAAWDCVALLPSVPAAGLAEVVRSADTYDERVRAVGTVTGPQLQQYGSAMFRTDEKAHGTCPAQPGQGLYLRQGYEYFLTGVVSRTECVPPKQDLIAMLIPSYFDWITEKVIAGYRP